MGRKPRSNWGFSPRAWGWSVPVSGAVTLGSVLPTCVGMVRSMLGFIGCGVGSPHVRGDGPTFSSHSSKLAMFSPRAWGWSVDPSTPAVRSGVLPTCVGMVRNSAWARTDCARSPHVRGDGPIAAAIAAAGQKFSPRAWGWSEGRPAIAARVGVLPTCVGMVRDDLHHFLTGDGSPHVRGDGPTN